MSGSRKPTGAYEARTLAFPLGGALVSGYDGRGFALGKKAHSDGFGFWECIGSGKAWEEIR